MDTYGAFIPSKAELQARSLQQIKEQYRGTSLKYRVQIASAALAVGVPGAGEWLHYLMTEPSLTAAEQAALKEEFGAPPGTVDWGRVVGTVAVLGLLGYAAYTWVPRP